MIWVRHCTVTGLSYRHCRAGCCFTSGVMSTALQITLMNFLNCNVKSKFWSALLKTQLLKHASVLVNPVKGWCCMILRNSCKEIPVCILLYSRFVWLDGGQTATPHWDCNGPLHNGCRHSPLWATSGAKAKCHQKASNNKKAGRSVFSNTVLHNHPVLVPSRHPQRGLSAPTLLGTALIMHMLFPQQLNYTSSDTLLERWNEQNLLAKKWTQESDASKQRAMGHNQPGALGSDFSKMDLVVSMSFKEECHVWLRAGSLYLHKSTQ